MSQHPRIVSLIASSTEMVHALGCGDWMVGRSHECDFPESVKALPQVTSPKFSPDGSSYEIDQRIKAIVQEGLSVYRVDADALNRLAPDIILTQDQCEVCAVSLKDVEAAACEIIASQPQIVSLNTNSLADLWRDIQRVANVIGVEGRGEELVSQLQMRMREVQDRAESVNVKSGVACIEWIDPLMAAGNWIPELVAMAGGANLYGEAGKHSPRMKWDDLVSSDPEIILIMPCGFDIPRIRKEVQSLIGHREWSELSAVKKDNVYLCDANQFMARPGPRLVESLEVIAEILHPELFDFGHHEVAWVRWDSQD